jgi:integrase
MQLHEVAVLYRDGKYKLVSAKTRSWERAEQKAREVRDTFDPIRQLQRRLEAQSSVDKSQIDIATAVDQFLKEVARLNRAEATCAKYKLTLARLLKWCATLETPATLLTQLDVATTRRWINSWSGAPTSLHNQHQRVIAFFNFCIEQGWIKDNPAKKIKKVPRQQEETLPFTREQYEALLEAAHYYDTRGKQRNGETTNSQVPSLERSESRRCSLPTVFRFISANRHLTDKRQQRLKPDTVALTVCHKPRL